MRKTHNLKGHFCLLLLLLIFASRADAQPFKQYYTVAGDNFTKGLHCPTSDSGMVMVTRSSNSNGSKYFTVFRTLANGDVLWTSRFVQPGNCGVSNIVELADSGFFFCFVELNYPEKYYITKLDRNGALVYCTSLTPPVDFIVAFDPQCIAKSDGGVYIASDLYNMTNNMMGWHLFEVNAGGTVVFSQCYNGGTLKCLGRNFVQCANGDLVMTGYQRDSLLMHYGPMVTRIDSDGVFLWSKLFIDTTADIAGINVTELQNGDLAVTASHTTPGNELIRLQTDAAGNTIRAYEYGNAAHGLTPVTTTRAENNSMIVFGTTDSGAFAVKLDAIGMPLHATRFLWITPNKVQQNPHGGYSFGGVDPPSNDAVIFTSDSALNSCFGTPLQIDTASLHFIVLNPTLNYPVPLYDTAFALMTDTTMGSNIKNCGTTGIAESETIAFEIYPNPACDQIQIQCLFIPDYIQLCDATGRIILSAVPSGMNHRLDVSPLPVGIYFVSVFSQSARCTQLIIIE